MNENEKPARPWDLFKKNVELVSKELAEERIAVCTECPFFSKVRMCKKCGCFMDAKVKLPHAFCPIGKWDAYKGGLLND